MPKRWSGGLTLAINPVYFGTRGAGRPHVLATASVSRLLPLPSPASAGLLFCARGTAAMFRCPVFCCACPAAMVTCRGNTGVR
jgi:hypothetical protein